MDFLASAEKDPRDNAYYTTEEGGMRIAMYAPSRVLKNGSGQELARYVENRMNFT